MKKSLLNDEQLAEIMKELTLPADKRRSVRDIAAAYGVTRNLVIGRLWRAGFRVPTNSIKRAPHRPGFTVKQYDAVIRELADDGLSPVAIAKEIGVVPQTIRNYMRTRGIARVVLPLQRADRPISDRRPDFNRFFAKQRPLAERDRVEMQRLAEEAIRAGRITKCPPARAVGSLTFHPSEFA
jgi:hypothetical protein